MTFGGRPPVAEWFKTLRFAGALVIVGICVVAIVTLALDVKTRLIALEAANSDNTQWVMMQTEVEVLRLQSAALSVLAEDQPEDLPAQLDEVRRWFNVFYSRVAMLEQSPVYAPLLGIDGYAADYGALRTFLDLEVPLIDGSDVKLREEMPDLARRLPEVRAAARSLTLRALADFASLSDVQRLSMSDTLLRLAILTVALILMLTALALVMARLYRVSETRAEEVRQTSARLSTIIANSADGIVVTDQAGKILEFNPAAQVIFGHRREAVLGKRGTDLLFADGAEGGQGRALRAAMADMADGREPLRMEIDARRGDGTDFPAEISIALSRPAGGSLVVAFVRDISDRRKAQRDLTDALDRALAGEKAKAEFLAVMSHEMRTPLNGLIGSMDLMGQTVLSAEQRELLGIMETSGDILLGHVNSVLDISKAEAGGMQIVEARFDLDRMIDDTVANQSGLAATRGTKLSVVQLSGPLGEVVGDAGRIRQILLNLIGNAVKFTDNGTVTVETECLVDSTGLPGRKLFEFRVIDSGIGISEDDLARIFEDFVTVDASYGRKQGGTGLGLGIARRLAEAMDGEIGAESVEGEGSLFWLRLPLGVVHDAIGGVAGQDIAQPGDGLAKVKTEPPAQAAPAPAATSLDVLVVEDNEINRFLLRRYLEAAGHHVTEAVDGLEGVERAAAHRYDAILMDVSMPRMDGVTATERIRTSGGPSAQTRILALTAHALPEEEQRFRSVGMETGLTKPISRVELLRRLSDGAEAGMAKKPDTAEADVLDHAALNELVEQIGQEMAVTLIQRLVAEAEVTVGRIGQLGGAANDAEVARLAHQLAGTCGTFGTARLRLVLSGVEGAVKTGARDALEQQRASLPAVWRATRAALEDQISVMDSVA